MSDAIFRHALLEDVDAIVDLVTSAYRGESSRVGWTTEADLLDGDRIDPDLLRADIRRPRSLVLLAGEAGVAGPIACAHIAEEAGAGYFGMFAVRPERQGAGLGHALLGEAERVVREDWRLQAMRMTVLDVRDELIAWYERRGYRRTGRFRPFPYGDARFGLPRRDDLRFEVLEKAL
ncbi:GNAT family N-acetyltransferase [Luteimonas sp. SJ-92]|uniref:GNAT family N-acetyltransferase n=1 Tax=Luteimonas salinisoli TaxID=2752307 RepID=A0A853JFG5_9GAMM|nr:GNAT family N-acetyltransferase [Luteimonas salinisoli]NZA27504.1 GNAT family N-acetyltransferase [Luteimonas salinisoli]